MKVLATILLFAFGLNAGAAMSPVVSFDVEGPIISMEASGNGRLIILERYEGSRRTSSRLEIRSMETGELLQSIRGLGKYILSPGKRYVVSINGEGLSVFDTETQYETWGKRTALDEIIKTASFLTESLLYVPYESFRPMEEMDLGIIIDLQSKERWWVEDMNVGRLWSLSPLSGNYLISSNMEGSSTLYDWSKRYIQNGYINFEKGEFKFRGSNRGHLVFSPDGKTIANLNGAMAEVYSSGTWSSLYKALLTARYDRRSVEFSANSRFLSLHSSGANKPWGETVLLDLTTGNIVHSGLNRFHEFSPGSGFATIRDASQSTLSVLDLQTGKVVFQVPTGQLYYSSDDQQALVVTKEKQRLNFRIYDTVTWKVIRDVRSATQDYDSLGGRGLFTPDNKKVITIHNGDGGASVKIYSLVN